MDQVVLVKGRVDHKEAGSTCLIVQSVEPYAPDQQELERARARAKATAAANAAGAEPLHLSVSADSLSAETLAELRQAIEESPGQAEVRARHPHELRDAGGCASAAPSACATRSRCGPTSRARSASGDATAGGSGLAGGAAAGLRASRPAARRRRRARACGACGRAPLPPRVGPPLPLPSPGVSSTHGRPLELGSRQEGGAASGAELALADVRVAVAVAAQRRHRVVEVQTAEALAADPLLELGHHRVHPRPRADVIAGGEQVARVQAHAEAPLAAGGLDQRGELLEAAPERPAGAGGVLQVQGTVLALGQRLADRAGRPLDRARPRPRSWPSRGAAPRRRRRSPCRSAARWSATAAICARMSRSSLAQLSR